ncbi:MAG: glycoside hydrolase family 2 TIM barrel-domain containing protein [Lutimonas sp.]
MKYFSLFLMGLLWCPLYAQESVIQYLSGTGADDTVSWEFYCTDGANSKEWKPIEVPSCWEQQGFGAYDYGTVPFEKRLNEEGHYKYNFEVEKSWENLQVDLIFEGVMTDCEVILNGKTIGKHQGAFYTFGFTISNLLNFDGENVLEVKVKKHSDNESVNFAERKADYWVFGGIFRPVYLVAQPFEHIARVAIDAKADGSFKADVLIENKKSASSIEVSVVDSEGIERAKFSKDLGKRTDSLRIKGLVENPKLWSTEFPNRYTVNFRLLDSSHKLLHQLSEKIGFRSIEVRAKDGIYVNGVKTKFRGANGHSFHPDHGRTSSKTLSARLVNTMKDMNMNAIRFSHYPHDQHLLNACDSLGLFVLDELAGWQKPSYDQDIGRKLLQEMIRTDVNHPSIILWDNGNEGGWNTKIDKYFGKFDIQKREVLHPGGSLKKTHTPHYPNYEELSFEHFMRKQIVFPTEFLHGLYDGGLGAGLDDYWEKMWVHPLSAGGFLWALADEDVLRTDTGKLDSDSNQAPDGILGPYFEKEGSYFAIKKIWSPIQLEERTSSTDFDGEFEIENRFQFTTLEQCSFQYHWVAYSSGQREVLRSGFPEVPALQPLERGIFKIPMDGRENADALEISANDPHGRLIYSWSFPVSNPKKIARTINKKEGGGLKFEENDKDYIFEVSNGIRISIGKEDGLLKSVSDRDGLIPISEGPVLIDNDLQPEQISHLYDGKDHKVFVNFENNKHAFEWTIEPSGLLHLEVSYEPKDKTYAAGIDFSFPESEMLKVKWMGNGPYRVWKNRLKGAEFGLWEKAYNNTITGYTEFVYPEFKGYHSNLYWAEITYQPNRSFRIYAETEDLFLKLFNPEEGPEPKRTRVVHSAGELSFLNSIPAIGTKFHHPGRLGPQSKPSTFLPNTEIPNKQQIKLLFDFRP